MKRILYRKSTKKIVVITRIDLLSGLDIYNGILEFADNGNLRWDVRLMQPIDVDITPAVIAKFVSDGIDGILLTFPLAENTIRALRDASIPIVLVGLRDPLLEERREKIAFIQNDNAGISRMAADHLFRCGVFNSFAYIPAEMEYDQYWSIEREKAFVEAVNARGRKCFVFEYDRPVKEWLESLPKPAAIMAACDKTAQDILNVCADAKIGVPKKISIIGVDNNILICRHSIPTLSSVLPRHSEMGYVAARELANLMPPCQKPSASGRRSYASVLPRSLSANRQDVRRERPHTSARCSRS